MKEKIRKEYLWRVRLIQRTELNGRNKIEAVNSFAVPVVQYSLDHIDWKISELKKIDTKTRKLLNMHKMLHPKEDMERLYIPRKDEGRGLIEVETARNGWRCSRPRIGGKTVVRRSRQNSSSRKIRNTLTLKTNAEKRRPHNTLPS